MSNPIIYYWSSNSGGTKRVAENLETTTQPIHEVETVNHPFILISPTYDQPRGGFTPKPVQEFLDKHSPYMVGVIGAGNRSFGDKFCMGAHEIAKRYNVPVLYRIEIMGLPDDYQVIDDGIATHWQKLIELRGLT